MASTIIHLAITDTVAKKIGVKDLTRLRLGSILPDCPIKKNASHLKVDDGEYVMFDLERFRKMFKDQLLSDPLYLGYYLHLVQDSLYRVFLYDRSGFNPRVEGNKERLYHDYAILNNYVVSKYGLTEDMVSEFDISGEPINDLDTLDVSKVVRETKDGFKPVVNDGLQVFTEDMLDSFMKQAEELCLKEAGHLNQEDMCIKNISLRWKKPL